jgi:hypothetical protein
MAITARQVQEQHTHMQNKLNQVQESMGVMKRMVQQCQSAWSSLRESFALLDAVGGAL